MCGIVGLVTYKGETVPNKDVIYQMTETLLHRGPDGGDVFLDSSCALGHRRLSIIDIDGGAQPMSSGNGRWWISYNGEIYNYKELRLELQSEGETFNSQGDTEVVLRGIAKYGPHYLKKLNGIFAIAIWDRETSKLLLARDHVGIKPLYFADTGSHFIFASEPKAIFTSKLIKKKLTKMDCMNIFAVAQRPIKKRYFVVFMS